MKWFVILALLMAIAIAGCTRTVYQPVPVEAVHAVHDNRVAEHLKADTVHDTRFVYIKGDTVIDWRDRHHVNRVEVHDTVVIERTDSIPVPYPVERKLTRWQQTKQDYGGYAIGTVAATICIAVVWLVLRKRI